MRCFPVVFSDIDRDAGGADSPSKRQVVGVCSIFQFFLTLLELPSHLAHAGCPILIAPSVANLDFGLH